MSTFAVQENKKDSCQRLPLYVCFAFISLLAALNMFLLVRLVNFYFLVTLCLIPLQKNPPNNKKNVFTCQVFNFYFLVVHLTSFLIPLQKYPPTKNRRPMGHIAHLRNPFKLMNTFERNYDHIYYKTDPVVQ